MSKDAPPKSGQYPDYVSFLKQNRTIEQATQIYDQRIKDADEVFRKFSNTFHNRDCPVCGDSEKRDLQTFHNSYGISECHSCLTKYVSPCPSLEALTYYYNECKCNALLGDLLRSRHKTGNLILAERTSFILDLIRKHFKDRQAIKVLEIGCSSGAFLSELKDATNENLKDLKIIYYGIDIDRIAISKNVDPEVNLEAISVEDFSENTSQKFDLILHFELLEHLQDPYSFMKSVRNLMCDNSLHHFHTPNANGFDNTALGYNDFRPLAHGIFPPMHLQAFTPLNITHFALSTGFKLLQIDTPGNFDVDIVRTFLGRKDSTFSLIHSIPENYLAIFQQWLKVLGASSHMRVTLTA